jgi:hypothetical protein
MAKVTVKVRKSEISLEAGESVHEFTKKLSDQAMGYVKDSLGMDDYPGYVEEIFADYVVFYVYGNGDSAYYAFTYKKNEQTDDFEFGEMIEVERRITFARKEPETTSIMKNACPGWVQKGLWGNIL